MLNGHWPSLDKIKLYNYIKQGKTCNSDFLCSCMAIGKFLSKLKGNFWGSAVSIILALYYKFPF